MADVDLTYVNAALTRTGNDPIASLTDEGKAAEIANANYQVTVLSVLAGYPWRWATKTKVLEAIDGDPDPPWLFAYERPSDLKHLRNITVDGANIDYEVQGEKILCNVDTSYEVLATYIWNKPEAEWPPEFGEYITIRMEELFLRGIGERYDQADKRARAGLLQFATAKTTDAKRRAPRDPTVSTTLRARLGTTPPTPTPLTWR